MTQKTKAIILVAIILLATIVFGWYLIKKNKVIIPALPLSQQAEQPIVKNDLPQQAQVQEKKVNIIEGKVRVISETQIIIEFVDGKGDQVKIQPSVPVFIESNGKAGNLSFLKVGAMVSIKVDQNGNALEITVKK